jgi:flagellar basal body rod protein FlgG
LSHGIYSALSGAVAQQRALEITANNVANANTSGFRSDRLAFDEALSRAMRAPAPPFVPSALRFVVPARTRTETIAGALRQTGNPLDLALSGDGFFTVRTPSGLRLTRAGGFVVDRGGVLRTPDGMEVMGEPVGGAGDSPGAGRGADASIRLVIPPGAREITVARDGTMSVDGAAIGRLRLVRVADASTLVKEGATRWIAPAGGLMRADGTEVVQGAVETSNVSAVAGVNELIATSRLFEAFQRVIRSFEEVDQRTARDLGARV